MLNVFTKKSINEYGQHQNSKQTDKETFFLAIKMKYKQKQSKTNLLFAILIGVLPSQIRGVLKNNINIQTFKTFLVH